MKDRFKGKGLIFIGGAPRSGTTLVQRIINAHNEVYGGPEFDLIPAIIRLKKSFDCKIQSGRINAFLDKQDADKIFSEFIKNLLFVKKEKEHVKYLSEKTPSNILIFNELMDLLPEAKYIVVVRDPRAVVSSMLEVGKKNGRKNLDFTQNVFASVQYINKCWDSGSKALEKPKTILVQYENIISSQNNEIQRIYSQLGLSEQEIKLSDSKFEYAEDKQSWNKWYTETLLKSDIHSVSLRKWKQFLKPYQINYIENSVLKNTISDIYFKDNLKRSEISTFIAKTEYVIDRIRKKIN